SIILLFVVLFLAACGGDQTEEDVNQTASDDNQETAETTETTETEETDLWAEIEEAGEITVATSGTLIAASFYDDDDKLTGYDVEVAKEIGDRLDLEVNFEIMGIDSMLPAIDSGRIDLAMNDIEATDSRKEQFN